MLLQRARRERCAVPARGLGSLTGCGLGAGGANRTQPTMGAGDRRPWYKLGQRNRVKLWWVSHPDKAPQHLLWSTNCFPEAGVSGFLFFCSPHPEHCSKMILSCCCDLQGIQVPSSDSRPFPLFPCPAFLRPFHHLLLFSCSLAGCSGAAFAAHTLLSHCASALPLTGL